ncbi:MAG: chromosomal replication initiator protein DnaA [Pirellulales bacterium]|nr:chromosomal replication initiator protein DnaA [Pirellulales bacterium]
MTRDDMEIVAALRERIAERIGHDRFELWFGSPAQLDLSGNALVMGVPSAFFRDWIRANFQQQIEEACVPVLGHRPTLRFRVPSIDTESAELSATPDKTESSSAAEIKRPAKPTTRSAGATRFATLESFAVGPANRVARASAEMLVQRPQQCQSLFIHGPTGVGKTHLLEGVYSAVRRRRDANTAFYLTAEQFTTAYVEALRGHGLPNFRQKYRGVDVLILDDAHFFRGKRSTSVELLHTIDTLWRRGGQLVVTADRPLGELSELGAELVSRLKGGMQVPVGRPEHATRLEIVRRMARRFQMTVPDDVLQYIAARLVNHARELSGALCRLQATSEAYGDPITLEMAEETLAEMIRGSRRPIRLPDIQKAICDVFGLEPESLQSGRRARQVSRPRMLAMWLARKHTRAALSEIGQFFGRRSHSTVVSAQKQVDTWLATDTTVDSLDQTFSIDEAIQRVERTLLAG